MYKLVLTIQVGEETHNKVSAIEDTLEHRLHLVL